ncbi:phage tail tape measure protein [Paludisphaera rhizosphaerae]|uniref:hypothetical protein n=1 Tax=Paludisphaera rhizosphaerae TaxID=2711216 RepID=UPI0013EA9F72|nr:hypothetical protein [Paludisphaera rhizosphaerae]
MATIGNINVGMVLDASGFARGLGDAGAEVKAFQGNVVNLGSTLRGLAVGFGALKVGTFLFDASKQAAHAQEAINSLSIVFGDEAGKMQMFASDMAKSFNVGVNSMLDAQNQIGSIFQGAGFKGGDVKDMTEGLTKIAMDMARLKDTSFELSKDKFLSGLSGEQEPLKAFGIVFDEATVKAKGLEMGLGGLGREMTAQEKVLARYAIFVDKTKFAMGTAAREATGAAAQFESLNGAWENLSVTIGETFAPALGRFLGDLSTGLMTVDKLWKDNEASATTWLTGLTANLGVATTGMGAFAESIGLVGDSIEGLGSVFKSLQSNVTRGVGKGAGLLGGIIGENSGKLGVGDFFKVFGVNGGVAAGGNLVLNKLGVGDFFKVFGEDLDRLSDEQAGKLGEALIGPSFSERIKKSFDEIRAEAERTRLALANKPIKIPTVKQAAGPGTQMQTKRDIQNVAAILGSGAMFGNPLGGLTAIVGAEAQRDALKRGPTATAFSGIARGGSQDAASTILRARYGGSKDPVAANTKKAADEIAGLRKDFKQGFKIKEGMAAGVELFEIK